MKRNSIILSLLLVFSAGALGASEQTVAPPKMSLSTAPSMYNPFDMPTLFDEYEAVPFGLFVFSQRAVQIGVECVAVPQCPDCTSGGNVCRGVREFYGGLIGAAVAKKNIIAKCQRANALDYCGGSRGCMKLSLQEQKRHRERNGGGCYAQCERVAKCVVQYRNP